MEIRGSPAGLQAASETFGLFSQAAGQAQNFPFAIPRPFSQGSQANAWLWPR